MIIMSAYTPCACRDCMDVTVSSDVSKPELCDACKEAGCGDPWAALWSECQREDAYEGATDAEYGYTDKEFATVEHTRPCGCGGTGVHGVDHED